MQFIRVNVMDVLRDLVKLEIRNACNVQYHIQFVKHAFSEHTYNEQTLRVK